MGFTRASSNGIEHGYPTAHEGTGGLGIKLLGQRDDPRRIGPDPVGESPVMADYGTHRAGAEMMIAGFAPFAGQAGVGEPSHANPLAERQSLGERAFGRDRTDNFVSGNQRIFADSPFVVQHTEIAVT